MDKGKPIPVILKKKITDSGPLEVEVGERRRQYQTIREEQVSLDKIIEQSDSKFYVTGKTTKIGLNNFLQLIEKHETGEIEGMNEEEIVVSSDLITQVASAPVVDEDQEDMKYIDSVAIGIFAASLFLSIFALLAKSQTDVRTFAWILLLVSLVFLGNYTYKGVKSGELTRVIRVCIKSLSRR